MTIGIFEFGNPNQRPGWKWFYPDPQVTCWSNYAIPTGCVMYLLNEYNTHFDLLVQREDVLCSVQSYQDKEQDNATEPVIDNTEEIELPGKETSSPLQFQPNVVSKVQKLKSRGLREGGKGKLFRLNLIL